MRSTTGARFMVVMAALAIGACRSNGVSAGPAGSGATSGPASGGTRDAADVERDECLARIAATETEPEFWGAPEFNRNRAEILGRARGEPVLFVQEPAPTPDAELTRAARESRQAVGRRRAFRRVVGLRQRLRADPAALRAAVLRQGYVYSSDPIEALALVSRLALSDLFSEPEVFLQRGATVMRLTRTNGRRPTYEHADGLFAGQAGKLLFGDRVSATRAGLDEPLHRDLVGAAHRIGFDRSRILRLTRNNVIAELRLGDTWVRALLQSDGAKLELSCLDAPAPVRQAIAAWQAGAAPRREALSRLRRAVAQQVAEAVPFDRPHGEATAERDGQLRPPWREAYLRGHTHFGFDGRNYPVFDRRGRPLPPQMCMDFVLDSYERAAGSWFSTRGTPPGRAIGALDFDAHGIPNRRGVLAFEKFAMEQPSLFEHLRFRPDERIAFRERSRFFGFLVREADRFAAGDVVAIQGLKGDGLVHQHAILIEDTDPVTGFPYALADQMRVVRQRTWEGIMAEAPLRSLLYRVRPRPEILLAGLR